MLHDHGRHIHIDIVVIVVGTVEVFTVDFRCIIPFRHAFIRAGIAGQTHRRHMAVGDIALLNMLIVQVYTGVGVQTKRHRRSNTPALVFDFITTGNAALLHHQVQTCCAVVAHGLVSVQRGTFLLIRAH